MDEELPREKKRKKRIKPPVTRARRRTIDPTMWGSVHLKGMFLEVDGVPTLAKERANKNGNDTSKHSELSERNNLIVNPLTFPS